MFMPSVGQHQQRLHIPTVRTLEERKGLSIAINPQHQKISLGGTSERPLDAPLYFGSDLITLGQGLIEGAIKQANTPGDGKKASSSSQSSWKTIFQRNLIFTTLLTVALAHSDSVYREAELGLNSFYGTPLETLPGYDPTDKDSVTPTPMFPLPSFGDPRPPLVKPPEKPADNADAKSPAPKEGTTKDEKSPGAVTPIPENPVTPKPANPVVPNNTVPTPGVPTPADPTAKKPLTVNQMIRMVREHRIILTTAYLYEIAKTGMVKEIHTPYSDKAVAPGVVPWNAILIDGSIVSTEMDADTRQKMLTELKIPVRNPITGFNIGWIEASLISALIVNGLSSLSNEMRSRIGNLLKGQKYKPPGPSEQDQKLMALYDTGRVLVATVLNVETSLITPDVLESHMGKLSLDKTLKPLSQEELKNRLIVLMAGPAVEKKYNHEQISVGSSGSLDTASQVAAMMVLKLGMGDNFGRYVPKELYGDAEKLKAEEEIRTLFMGAEKRAREIIDQYAHRLEPLKEALTTLKVLSRDEVLLILEGKNVADIKKERGLFFRLKQSMGGAKKTHANGNTTTTTINQKVDLNQVSSAPAQGQMSAEPLLLTKESKVSS